MNNYYDHKFTPWTIDGDACRRASDDRWRRPVGWNREYKWSSEAGDAFRVLVTTDVYKDWKGSILDSEGVRLSRVEGACEIVTTMNDLRRDLFALIDATPHLNWLLLTKRPENVIRTWPQWSNGWGVGNHRSNVWLGTSVSDQATADAAIPHLLECRDLSPVLFVSAEPLLGPVTLDTGGRSGPPRYMSREVDHPEDAALDWVIVGGESGPNARPCHPDWVRSIRDQCTAAGVPFWFEGWGEWAPNCLCANERPHPQIKRPEPGKMGCMFRCGKKAAGRMLDGRTWEEWP